MSMNIYVGNLNYRVREEDLTGLLQQYGAVTSARVITDRETGRSRGFGFVEMEDENDARHAIEELFDQEFQGRKLIVKEALERPERAPRRTFRHEDRY
ncbi:RNA recognition motif domain-containing protein [Porphyromonas gingivalis]|uniref:RNA recognition motif domain-containing protein n=1 Tax=Porphyromonas gingivalis TaxID=837 RepID=UPI000BE70AC9|nr:RNA-binding protein [Porphyromonas gingivalis]PDP77952.1 RNA-binding protein [Porphyromonas gingivalis]